MLIKTGNRGGRPRISDDKIRQIVELTARKYTHQSIADYLCVGLATVKRYQNHDLSGLTTASLEVLE